MDDHKERMSMVMCYGNSFNKNRERVEKFWASKPQFYQNFLSMEEYFRETYGTNLCITFNSAIDKITAVLIMHEGSIYMQDIIIPASKYTTLSYIQHDRDKFLTDLYNARLKIFLSPEIEVGGTAVAVLVPREKYAYKDVGVPLSKFRVGHYQIQQNSLAILYGEKFTLGTNNNGTWDEISCLSTDTILVQRFIINHCKGLERGLYDIFK